MKRIIALILIILTVFSFTACSLDYEEYAEEAIDELGFVSIEHMGSYGENLSYLVYHPETKVMYIFIDGGSGSWSICPYYDKNGDVAIYKGYGYK